MKSLCLILLPALTLCASAHAALTFDEALARTVAQHPRLLAHAARIDATAAFMEQAGYVPNPVLNVRLENFGGSDEFRGVDALESTIELSQTLERGEKRSRRVAQAAQARELAAAEAAVARAELLASTAEDYLAVVIAAQHLTLADEGVRLAESTLAHAEARRAAGDASAVEPARARAALAIAQSDARQRGARLRVAEQKLAAHWHGNAADVTAPARLLTLPEAPPDTTSWLAGVDHHPRLALETARVAERRAALDLEQANARSDLNLVGGVRHLRDSASVGLVAGVSVPLPLRHRNQAAIRAARQTLASADYEVSAATREVRAAFALACAELEAAHAAARQVRDHALPAAREAAALLQRAYASGQAAQYEAIEAEHARAAVQRQLLELQGAYAVALVRAEKIANPAFPATRQLLSAP